MSEYLKEISDDGAVKTTAYRVADGSEFFKSVNDWLNFEGGTEAYIKVLTDDYNNMIIVDGCDDDKKVLGIDGVAVTFKDEFEINECIKLSVEKYELVDLLKAGTVH